MPAQAFRFMALAGALLFLGSVVQAQNQVRGGHRVHPQRQMDLGLTETQKCQVKALRERHEATRQAKADALREAREALRAAMAKPDAETARLSALHDKLAAAQFDLLLERRSLHQEMLPLLTPEQRAQLEKRMSEGRQGDRRGRDQGVRSGSNQGLAPTRGEAQAS